MSNSTNSRWERKLTAFIQATISPTVRALLFTLVFTLFLTSNFIAFGQCTSDRCLTQYPRGVRSNDKTIFNGTNTVANLRTAVKFNEYICLPASKSLGSVSRPTGAACDSAKLGTGFKIRAWYIDEHALSLGVDRVIVIGGANPRTVDAPNPVSPSGSAPPYSYGFSDLFGDLSGNDNALSEQNGGGRPLRPSLFITDITNEPNEPYIGDWQQGASPDGRPFEPTLIVGTWKSAIKTVDYNSSPYPKISYSPGVNPLKNDVASLGPDNQPPAGTATDKFNAMIEWDIDSLNARLVALNKPEKFEKGHTYRLQFMVHDGDQNKAGGDVGERCGRVHIVNPPKPIRCEDTTICAGGVLTFPLTAEDPDPTTTFTWSILPAAGQTTTDAHFVGPSNTQFVTVAAGNLSYILQECAHRDGFDACCDNGGSHVTVLANPTCSIDGGGPVCGGTSKTYTSTILNPIIGSIITHSWTITGNGTITGTSNGGATVMVLSGASGTYSLRDDIVRIFQSAVCPGFCTIGPILIDNCTIGLTKTPSPCEVEIGASTPVTYTYVIKNNASYLSAIGNLIDDNGSPGNTGDDFTVQPDWGTLSTPLAPGASISRTATVNLIGARTNIAKASATFISALGTAQATATATATATVTGYNCVCDLRYPDNSNLPRSNVTFNESEVLRKSDPNNVSCGYTGSTVKLWYNDEHALTLGVRQVTEKRSNGIFVIGDYPVTPFPDNGPICVSNPDIGATDNNGNDLALGGGRPLRPSIFITDLTVNGANSRIGDWQQGGTGISPHRVCGSWKAAVRQTDYTKSTPEVTVKPDPDPSKNDWNLGNGADPVPTGLTNQGFGAECSWDVNTLGLLPGHTYRLQFMVHDGDQNKSGGDVGQSCTTIHIPPSAPCVATPKTDETEAALPSANEFQYEKAGNTTDSRFAIYPNPATEKLNLAFISPIGGDAQISMTDVNGKMLADLYKGKVESGQLNKTTVDMNNFATGVYIIQFKCHDSIITKKLILEK